MIIEFKCSNHRSINEEVKFSMLANTDDTDGEKLIPFGDERILPSAVIYGANGSGKSNLLSAMEFMQFLVIHSILAQPGDDIHQIPHKLAPVDAPSSYFMQFTRNGIRYAYSFTVQEGRIAEEFLYYFPNGKHTCVFERAGDKVDLGSRFRSGFDSSLEVLKENRLFLSCAANFSKNEVIKEAFLFFKEDIVSGNIIKSSHLYKAAGMISSNPEIKNTVLVILKGLGTGIRDITVNKKEVDGTVYDTEFKLLRDDRRFFELEIRFVYDRFDIPYDEESVGTRKLFQLLCIMLEAIYTEKVMICDELETSIHETLAAELINLFRGNSCDSSAQLIFTTHDTGLLSRSIFRRDQIWFTQLRENDRSTDIYSLSDIRNVRKSENFEKGYVSGRYGAIPMLNRQFIEDFCLAAE